MVGRLATATLLALLVLPAGVRDLVGTGGGWWAWPGIGRHGRVGALRPRSTARGACDRYRAR